MYIINMVLLKYLSRLSYIPLIVAWRFPVLLESNQLSTADICEKILPSIFRIICIHPQTQEIQGVGSGFFIKKDGTGLTASHVLSPNHSFIAKLDTGEECSLKILNTHPLSDIALVKVKTTHPVPFLQLGDSEKNRRGEQVIHFGNSLYGTTTEIDVGYINKLKDDTPKWIDVHTNEKTDSMKSGISYILTSGSVRPGFSGGPLVNMNGEVIGLINRLYIRNQYPVQEHEGASVPINIVKSVIKQMELSGNVKRPYLGLSFTPSNPGLAIVKVQPGSPAERAGVKVGDILLTANSKAINNLEDLYAEIGFQIGIVIEFKVLRRAEQLILTVYT